MLNKNITMKIWILQIRENVCGKFVMLSAGDIHVERVKKFKIIKDSTGEKVVWTITIYYININVTSCNF